VHFTKANVQFHVFTNLYLVKSGTKIFVMVQRQLKALGSLEAFEEAVDWDRLSRLCDDSDLHVSVFK